MKLCLCYIHFCPYKGESNAFPHTAATADLLGILPDNYATAHSAAGHYTWKAAVVGEEGNAALLGGRRSLALKVRTERCFLVP